MTCRSVKFVFGLVIIALSSSFATRGLGQEKLWRIGWLSPDPAPTPAQSSDATYDLATFREAMGDLGWVEGRSYVIDSRFADTDWDRLPTLAKELVDSGVDIIVTIGTPPVTAARNATSTIPIVMAGSADPVEHGLVASLAHPGGNVTGVTHSPGPKIAGKCLGLLREVAPNVSRVAILWDSGGMHEGLSLDVQRAAARDLKIALLVHDVKGVKSADQFGSILSEISEERADALFAFPNFVNGKYGQAILDFVTAYRLPSFFQSGGFVEKGGLLYYYTDWGSLRRRAATYVDQILKGVRPADLPVEQPSKFQLIINLKTATALGLTVPPSILATADEVIE
jgi:putative ABC transport system substrate-binding protein